MTDAEAEIVHRLMATNDDLLSENQKFRDCLITITQTKFRNPDGEMQPTKAALLAVEVLS